MPPSFDFLSQTANETLFEHVQVFFPIEIGPEADAVLFQNVPYGPEGVVFQLRDTLFVIPDRRGRQRMSPLAVKDSGGRQPLPIQYGVRDVLHDNVIDTHDLISHCPHLE